MRDIGLAGLARSGKDTVAGMLVERHGYTRVAFADILKKVALDVNPQIAAAGWPLLQVVGTHGWEAAKEVPEVRRFLQNLGVAVRENLGRDTWVRAALERPFPGPIVVSDVRFVNEALAVQSRGGWVVEVRRPGAGLHGAAALHASEQLGWLEDVARARLDNDGTLDNLAHLVDWLVEVAADA